MWVFNQYATYLQMSEEKAHDRIKSLKNEKDQYIHQLEEKKTEIRVFKELVGTLLNIDRESLQAMTLLQVWSLIGYRIVTTNTRAGGEV